MGARWLYVSLLRRLSYNAFNNGKLFRSTREAAKEIGATQRAVWIWFKELEHYGFIVMTDPGCIGPKGRAARWRITDMAWGEMDGKPVEATKDYLHWDGVLFERKSQKLCSSNAKRENSEQKTSGCRTKDVTPDEQKTSPPPPTDEQKTSDGGAKITELKTSDLVQPSPPAKEEAA
jgi:hypothetical protein